MRVLENYLSNKAKRHILPGKDWEMFSETKTEMFILDEAEQLSRCHSCYFKNDLLFNFCSDSEVKTQVESF